MARPSAFCRLTARMECDGVFLVTEDDGRVLIRAHRGDAAGLERWSVPAVRSYILNHEPELHRWLRTPLDDLPTADRHALYAGLGATGRTGRA